MSPAWQMVGVGTKIGVVPKWMFQLQLLVRVMTLVLMTRVVSCSVVVPPAILGNTDAPDGTIFVSHDFVADFNFSNKTDGAWPYLTVELMAADAIRNSGVLGSRRINLEIVDDQENILVASGNLISFVHAAQQNVTRYGEIIGVVGSLTDITTSLAITSGSLQLAHSSISGVMDLLNRATYPLHLSSGISYVRIADTMMALASAYNWRHFSMLVSMDSYGRSFRDCIMTAYSNSFTIAQHSFSPSPSKRASTLDLALQSFLSTENRVLFVASSLSYGSDIYAALQRAGLLNNPRYVIIGADWVQTAGYLPWISQVQNVIGVLPTNPSPAQVTAFTSKFSQKLQDMNMTSVQKSASMRFLAAALPYVAIVYNSMYAMMFGAATVWSSSLPINGSNIFQAMSTLNVNAAFDTPLRYDDKGFALYDIAIIQYNNTNRAFTETRLVYTGVVPIVNNTVAAQAQFTTLSPMVFIDGVPPPDRSVYSLLVLPSNVTAYRNGSDGLVSITNNNLVNTTSASTGTPPRTVITMVSGSKLPNGGYMVIIHDQTGLVATQQTISLWEHVLNEEPVINAIVTDDDDDIHDDDGVTSAISGTPSFTMSDNSILAVASFSDLIITARPGTTVYLHFQCILPGGPLKSPTIAVRMADCQSGSFIDPRSNVCTPCQAGFYTQGATNALSCVPILHEMSTGVTTAFIGLSGIGMMLVAVVFAYVVVLTKGHSRTIYHYSPSFCMITLAGIGMVFASVIGMVMNPVASCNAVTVSTWLFNLGFTATFGSMFAKSYRLYKIFHNILYCMTAISNKQLYTMLAALAAVDVLLLGIWQGVDPYTLHVGSYRTCDVGTAGGALKYTLICIKGSLLLLGMYLTHATRRVPSTFSEHKASTVAIYNSAVIGVVILGIWFGMQSVLDQVTISIVLAMGAFIGALSTLCLIFGHLLYDVYIFSGGSQGKANNLKLTNLLAKATAGAGAGAGAAGAAAGATAGAAAGPGAGAIAGSNSCFVFDGLGAFDGGASPAQYSILEGAVATIHRRSSSCAGDREFLSTYSQLQAVMRSLTNYQQKKRGLLQKLALIWADKDYQTRTGQMDQLHGRAGARASAGAGAGSGSGATSQVGIDIGVDCSRKDSASAGVYGGPRGPRDRRMSITFSTLTVPPGDHLLSGGTTASTPCNCNCNDAGSGHGHGRRERRSTCTCVGGCTPIMATRTRLIIPQAAGTGSGTDGTGAGTGTEVAEVAEPPEGARLDHPSYLTPVPSDARANSPTSQLSASTIASIIQMPPIHPHTTHTPSRSISISQSETTIEAEIEAEIETVTRKGTSIHGPGAGADEANDADTLSVELPMCGFPPAVVPVPFNNI